MAKLPGLFQREGVYQLRVVIPKDVRAAYNGKSKVVQSLGTTSYREATLLATQERAKLLEEFAHKRLVLSPQRLDSVTPEMASELAQRVRATVLRVDDVLRDQPQARAALFDLLDKAAPNPLEALTIRSTKPVTPAASSDLFDSLAGLSDGDAAALASLNSIMDGAAMLKLARRNLAAILPLVKEEAQKLGLTFDPQALGAREALLMALKAYRQAWQEVTQRDSGEIVDTPVIAPVKKSTAKPLKLRDVYTRWKDSKPRSEDSQSTCLRAVALYEEFTGNPPIDQLTREQGDAFRAWLQQPERKTASKTARDRLVWVKSLLKYAHKDLELISRNPWEGLEIPFKTTNKRRPWSDDELQTFFTQDLYTTYKLPADRKAGADAAYWIPLIGMYTGARVGELAQLRVADVDTAGEFPLLSVTDEGEGQSVKTQAGVRKVPVHSELVRLGFLDYVDSLRGRNQSLLWPSLPTRKDKIGGYFSQWFGDFRKSLGFGMYPDFHCLRHTVRSQMAEAEIDEALIDTVVGHEVKGSTGTKVYTHRTKAALRKAIEALSYPTLSLPRVYKAR